MPTDKKQNNNNNNNTGAVLTTTLGTHPRDGVERVRAFLREQIPS